MSLSFFINGKEYIQSNTLCASFGYSSDYIAKLAREEKVLGTLVGRQWFVEPESLRIHLLKIAIQKNIQKEELSLVRKRERSTAVSLTLAAPSLQVSETYAFAQSLAIMLCGLLVGGLSWVSVQEGVGLGEIATGIESSAVQVAGVFKPEVFTSNSLFVIDAQEASVLTSIKNQNAGETINPSGEVFANLPVFPVREGSGDADSHKLAVTKQSSLSQRHFSDEIEIIKDEQGREFIEPVFKNGGDAPLRFIVEEVSRQEQ